MKGTALTSEEQSVYDSNSGTQLFPHYHSLTPSLPHSLPPSFPHSLTYLLTYSLTHSLTHCLSRTNPGCDEDKIKHLQSEIKNMVEKGVLTESEKAELVGSLESNLTAIMEEINDAKRKNEDKKIGKLEEKRNQMIQRKESITKVTHSLTHYSLTCSLYLKRYCLVKRNLTRVKCPVISTSSSIGIRPHSIPWARLP